MVLYRVLKGPTVPDRVTSLDVAAVIVMAPMGVLCVRTDDSSYLDVAVVLAIIVFLSTVAFGRYLERRARQ